MSVRLGVRELGRAFCLRAAEMALVTAAFVFAGGVVPVAAPTGTPTDTERRLAASVANNRRDAIRGVMPKW
jgi:hypothetical protein